MSLSQDDWLLNELRSRPQGITALEAFRERGIMRMSARVYDLRRRGFEVTRKFVERKNRFGEYVHVALYQLSSSPVATCPAGRHFSEREK